MVWITRIIILLNLLFFSQYLYSNDLNKDELMIFNFIDFDNDNQISFSEINQSVSLVFQLVDLNEDGFISQSEIKDLKSIVDSLR